MLHIPETKAMPRRSRVRANPDSLALGQDLLFGLDLLLGIGAGLTALVLYGLLLGVPVSVPLRGGPLLREILFGSLVASLLLRDGRGPAAPGTALLRFGLRASLAFAALMVIGLATRSLADMARLWVLIWAGLFAAAAAAARLLLAILFRLGGSQAARRESVAIIGGDGAIRRLVARLGEEANVIATFPEGLVAIADGDGGPVDALFELGRGGDLDSIVVAVAEESDLDVGALVERIRELPVQVALCPDPGVFVLPHTQTRVLGGVPMAIVADRPIRRWNFIAKEIIDRVGALLIGLLLAPLMLLIALLVALQTPGPVIFRQTRSGWGGAPFTILKFRTMHVRHDEPFSQTRRGDGRCTGVGRFLRRTSLDELPQLWNVLRGEMSLVGPRPHAEEFRTESRLSCEIVSEYALRRRVKPGITGWAQINGCRGATRSAAELRRRIALDMFYIENWSLLLDLRILLRTPLQVLLGENAF